MAKNKSLFAQPQFNDETAARAWFEAARWPNGPVCAHCQGSKHYATKKAGRYRCGNPDCRKDFTVMTGSVMERSHAPLTHWAVAFAMGAAGKKGFSAHQLHRHLGCQYNTAWFLHHRVMEAMRNGGLVPPMGGEGKVVEVDETYFGKVETPRARNKYLPAPTKGGKVGPAGKRAVIALVERGGNVRTFHVARADALSVQKIMDENVKRETVLYTDESRLYTKIGKEFAAHATVNHSSGEYVRKGEIHTNTVEGYFSIFKRGMRGVYQHCAEKNLHRYLAEFDFRYNTRQLTDAERTLLAVKGAEGKRLTYRRTNAA